MISRTTHPNYVTTEELDRLFEAPAEPRKLRFTVDETTGQLIAVEDDGEEG